MKISTGETKKIGGEYLLPSKGGPNPPRNHPQKERLEGGRFGGRESKRSSSLERMRLRVAVGGPSQLTSPGGKRHYKGRYTT